MLPRIRTVLGSQDDGASAVEYGLLVAGIAAVIIVVVFALGGTISGLFEGVNECIDGEPSAGCPAPDPEVEG